MQCQKLYLSIIAINMACRGSLNQALPPLKGLKSTRINETKQNTGEQFKKFVNLCAEKNS